MSYYITTLLTVRVKRDVGRPPDKWVPSGPLVRRVWESLAMLSPQSIDELVRSTNAGSRFGVRQALLKLTDKGIVFEDGGRYYLLKLPPWWGSDFSKNEKEVRRGESKPN